jgi:hypothetical protein
MHWDARADSRRRLFGEEGHEFLQFGGEFVAGDDDVYHAVATDVSHGLFSQMRRLVFSLMGIPLQFDRPSFGPTRRRRSRKWPAPGTR